MKHAWLNDVCMNSYFENLRERESRLCLLYPERKRHMYVSSYNLNRFYNTEGKFSHKTDTWTQDINVFKDVSTISGPVNFENSHWVYLLLDCLKKLVQIFDPLGGDRYKYMRLKYLDGSKQFLIAEVSYHVLCCQFQFQHPPSYFFILFLFLF